MESSMVTFSVLLVSNLPGFCANLRFALFGAKKHIGYKLQVHICESVKQVIHSNHSDIKVDFVVFGLDVQRSNCVEQVKEDLKLLNNTDVSFGGCCMVISTSVPNFKMGVSWESLLGLETTYQMPRINGDTDDEDKCNYLGERILHLIESANGLHSVIPFLTASVPDELEEERVVVRRHLAFMDTE